MCRHLPFVLVLFLGGRGREGQTKIVSVRNAATEQCGGHLLSSMSRPVDYYHKEKGQQVTTVHVSLAVAFNLQAMAWDWGLAGWLAESSVTERQPRCKSPRMKDRSVGESYLIAKLGSSKSCN